MSNTHGGPMDLTGSTVLVTGASSGIGRETAILLSSLNARVVLAGRNAERLEQTRSCLSGEDHRVEIFDLENVGDIPKWVRSIAANTGPLNALVHSAGTQHISPVRFVSPEAAEHLLRTNLMSAIMLAQGFCHRTCHAPGSSLVFFSSVMGLSGKPSMSVYGASKAGLLGLVKSLAAELSVDGIRVNCIAPACVRTEMLNEMSEFFSTEQFAALEKEHPLGFGTPRDVANAVAFLVADTGRWITGSTLVVDGGYSSR